MILYIGIALVVVPIAAVAILMWLAVFLSSLLAWRDLLVPSIRQSLDDAAVIGASAVALVGPILIGVSLIALSHFVGGQP